MTCLRQVKGLIFLAKPQRRKEFVEVFNLSHKMGKVGFLCGFAPLRDQKFFKGLAKAGGK
jgi:hypothetical protein